MKKTRLLILIALCLAVFGTNSFSQGSFMISLAPSIPLGVFGSDDENDTDAAGAGIGVGIGMQYTYKLMENGLGIFGGLDILYNGLKGDLKDEIKQNWEDEGLTDLDIKYPTYLNFPISVGLNFTFQANDQIALLANAGVALNFAKVTNMVIEGDGEEAKIVSDLGTSVGFKLGGGVLINDKIAFTLHYLGLGESEIDQSLEYDGNSDDAGSMDIKVSILTIGVGLNF